MNHPDTNHPDTHGYSVALVRVIRSAVVRVAIVSSVVAASFGVMPSAVLRAAPGAGGIVTTYSSGGSTYTVHTFTTTGSSTFTTPSGVTSVEYLIVGGGGGGGSAWIDTTGGSGGGGGQVLTGTATVTAETDYTMIVGAGGAGGVLALNPTVGQNGADGTASSAFAVSAGGGFGAIKSHDAFVSPGTGKAGNSGGNLFTGANGVGNGNCKRGGGGAGAGENGYVGQNVISGADDTSATGSKGGNGVSSSLRTGTATYYGGGGGGAGTGNCAQSGLTAGSGGLGGGGNSATWNKVQALSGTCCSGFNGAANTGGGGGGQSGYGGQGGNGGSGIVVVRYLSPQTVTWSPVTALDTTDSPATPSVLATALGGASISYSVVSRTTSTCTVGQLSGVLTFTGAGNCVVRATAAAIGNLDEASATVTFVVSRVAQSALAIATSTGTYGNATPLTTTGGSGTGAVSYAVTGTGTASGCAISGASLVTTSTGTCKVTATKAADDTYSSRSSVETTVTISRGSQTSLTVTSTTGTVNAALPITVTGGSGSGAVTFELLTGGTGDCSISGSSIIAKSVGTCRIKVTKAADTNVLEQTVTETITFAAPVSQAEISTGTTAPSATTAPASLPTAAPAQSVTATTIASLAATSGVASTNTAGTATTIATTIATTTTSTTVAKTETAVVQAPEIAAAQPGSGAVEINGELVAGSTSRIDNQLIVTAGSLTVGIAAIDENGTVQPLDANGNVFVQPEDLVQVTATGFKSESDVEVWMFSTPTQLGNVTVNEEGELVATFTVPKSTESGDHRIALVGTDINGKEAKFAVGLIVGSMTTLSTTAKVLIAVPIIGAVILALLLPTRIRRRRRLAV